MTTFPSDTQRHDNLFTKPIGMSAKDRQLRQPERMGYISNGWDASNDLPTKSLYSTHGGKCQHFVH